VSFGDALAIPAASRYCEASVVDARIRAEDEFDVGLQGVVFEAGRLAALNFKAGFMGANAEPARGHHSMFFARTFRNRRKGFAAFRRSRSAS